MPTNPRQRKFPQRKVESILRQAKPNISPRELDTITDELKDAVLKARILMVIDHFLGADIAQLVITALEKRKRHAH